MKVYHISVIFYYSSRVLPPLPWARSPFLLTKNTASTQQQRSIDGNRRTSSVFDAWEFSFCPRATTGERLPGEHLLYGFFRCGRVLKHEILVNIC